MYSIINRSVLSRNFILSISIIAAPILLLFSRVDPSDIPRLLDIKSLSTILFFLLISRGFLVSGLSSRLAQWIRAKGKARGFNIILFYLLSTMILSMLATNDGAVLVMIPVGLKLSEITGWNPISIIVLGLIAANTGSILFPFGNPQNIIIWQYYNLSFTSFMRTSSLVFVTASVVLLLVAYIEVGGKYLEEKVDYPRVQTSSAAGYTTLALLLTGIILSDRGYGPYAFLLALAIFFIADKYIVYSVDWSLALLFVFLFLDFNSLALILSRHLTQLLTDTSVIYLGTLITSQVISNVPTTIFLTKITHQWTSLVVSANIAGYLTPIGSLANLIGLRLTGINWKDYLEKSLVFSFTITIIGYIITMI
ncbi:MAG: hypothetical protein F7B59_01400 [Desulfurococcales archaeon]|nr:hypothetical protein [Desulfurococcales archaeon]